MKVNSAVFLEFPDRYVFNIIREMITHEVKDFFKGYKGFLVTFYKRLITIGTGG